MFANTWEGVELCGHLRTDSFDEINHGGLPKARSNKLITVLVEIVDQLALALIVYALHEQQCALSLTMNEFSQTTRAS